MCSIISISKFRVASMKKIISFILFICILISCVNYISFSVSALSGTTGECGWQLEGKVLYINGNGKMADYQGEDTPWGNDFTEVIIGEGVTEIGEFAFAYTSVSKVSLAESVEGINFGAFLCTPIKEITFGEKVKYIDAVAFEGSKVEKITFKGATILYSNAFDYCENLTEIDFGNGGVSIGSGVFSGCSAIEKLNLETVEEIGGAAFGGCTALKQITIGNEIKEIGGAAFSGCISLESVIVGDNVEKINDYAFSCCTGLKEVIFGAKVKEVGDEAFLDCSSLEKIELNGNAVNFGYNAIYNTAYFNNEDNWEDGVLYLENVLVAVKDTFDGVYTIKKGTKLISSYAFFRTSSLAVLYVPSSMEKIGDSAFEECISLLEVYYEGDEETWLSLNENYFKTNNEALVYAYVNFQTDNVLGDCDGDGTLTTTDLAVIKLILAGIEKEYDNPPDINQDGVFDVVDLATLKLMLANT